MFAFKIKKNTNWLLILATMSIEIALIHLYWMKKTLFNWKTWNYNLSLVASSLGNLLVFATEQGLFVKTNVKQSPIECLVFILCVFHAVSVLCCQRGRNQKTHSAVVVVIVSAPTTYTSVENTCPDCRIVNETSKQEVNSISWKKKSNKMGNIDTKLNFRKAIVQLGTKNQVCTQMLKWQISEMTITKLIDFF